MPLPGSASLPSRLVSVCDIQPTPSFRVIRLRLVVTLFLSQATESTSANGHTHHWRYLPISPRYSGTSILLMPLRRDYRCLYHPRRRPGRILRCESPRCSHAKSTPEIIHKSRRIMSQLMQPVVPSGRWPKISIYFKDHSLGRTDQDADLALIKAESNGAYRG